MSRKTYSLSPIGHVRASQGSFALHLEKEYVPALLEVDGFSHLNVLWWCNQLDDDKFRRLVECDKPYKNAPKKLGIFATRSPVRPNPIALSVVQVLGIDHASGIVNVAYLDAEDGSPILDLKPYHPAVDRVREVSVPSWCSHWPGCYEDSARFDWESELIYPR